MYALLVDAVSAQHVRRSRPNPDYRRLHEGLRCDHTPVGCVTM